MARTWEPSLKDATSLAAFRWFANTIENKSIALYVTKRETYKPIEDILRRVLRELDDLKKQHAVTEEENGCPDGFVVCDGVCQPSCDGEDSAAQPSYASVKKP